MYFLQNFYIDEEVKPLCFNAINGVYLNEKEINILKGSSISFESYFNVFPLAKWGKYTVVDDLHLKISGSGKVNVLIKFLKKDKFNNSFQITRTKEKSIDLLEGNNLFVAKVGEAEFISLSLTSLEDVVIKDLKWMTSTKVKNHIKLNLATVSYNKEKYLFRNLEKIEKTLNEFEYNNNISVSVIDTGNSLKAEDVERSDAIKLYPTTNDFGASGGFSRAAIEAISMGSSHVAFMDDDIEITSESIIRPYMFLSYLKEEFLDSHGIAGSMFMIENKIIQHVQAGCLTNGGLRGTMPSDIDMSNIINALENELKESNSSDKLFSGFWFTIFPTTLVIDNGLMLPCFIKCDDIDFGVNTVKGKFITLNGAAVWHEDFYSKENAIFNVYYDMRNLLMTFAINDDKISKKTFFKYFLERFYNDIKLFKYKHAYALLLALDDFSKGLSFIENVDNKSKIKEISENNLVYRAEPLDFSVDNHELIITRNGFHISKLKRAIRKITFNGYLFPNALCFDRPKPMHYVIANSQYAYRAKKLVHIDSRSETGYMVERDVKEAIKLIIICHKKIKKIKPNLVKLCDDYRQNAAKSRSIETWKERLFNNAE
ncbi:hypothetical protein KW514_15365 [Vibrio fluvialis]|nr:hypothetical protein [Vibrio fluvialis]MBY8202533.1 hypothetical protein [Vibrio fluvialis]MBY8206440.1 hypothetical protein [Vibrio fluvialis]